MRPEMETVARFFEPPKGSYFLFGPRGTGKSFWTQNQYPEALRLDLLQPDVHREFAAHPERLRELAAPPPRFVALGKGPALARFVIGG